MMEVNLLSYTPDALDLLLRTKGTRLKDQRDVATWTDAQKAEHLEYMRDTIKSSWEFVDYTFELKGVSRAFTHQLVRTRTGSYAQEAMRVIDASGFDTVIPPAVSSNPTLNSEWGVCMADIDYSYRRLVNLGLPRQDARGVLPTNVATNIITKLNLRTLYNMAELRLCTRTQGEYQDVFRAMRARVIEVHPWAADFINVYCANHGTCAFPRYGAKECHWYQYTADGIAREAAQDVNARFWARDAMRQEANPIVKDGKAM